MNQNRKQCAPGSENISRKGGVAPLNSRNVKFMERFAIQTSIAAANDGREKGFHLPETIRQQASDSSDRAAYYIPSKPPFVDSGAVRQNTHEPEDAYPIVQDYADLLGQGVLPFVTSQESFATRSGANQLMTL